MNTLYEKIHSIHRVKKLMHGDDHKKLLETCGKSCAKSQYSKELARALTGDLPNFADIDHLVDMVQPQLKDNQRLSKEGKTIVLESPSCVCPLVNNGTIVDPDFCNCTIGKTKAVFEYLLGKQVQVVLEKTILNGDDCCKQRILPY